jgi:hypothetical protein
MVDKRAMTKRWTSAMLLGALAVTAAACGSSSSDDAGSQPTNAPTSAAPTSVAPTSAAPKVSDDVLARSIVLQASDLSGIWHAGDVEPQDQTGDAEMAKCLGIADSDLAQTAYAASRDFDNGATQISSSTSVFKTASAVEEDERGVSSDKLVPCFVRAFETDVASEGASNLQLTRAALPAGAGSLHGFHLTGSFDVTSNGQTVHATVDFLGLAKARVEVEVTTVAIGGPVSAALVDQATTALAHRLNAKVADA